LMNDTPSSTAPGLKSSLLEIVETIIHDELAPRILGENPAKPQ